MVRGITALFTALGVIERNSATWVMLDNIGNTVFMFMPVFIALTASRKFKVNEMIGIFLGATLMNPTIFNLASGEGPIGFLFQGTIFEVGYHQTVFGGIPWIVRDYASTVIPAIIVIWFASYVQRGVKRVIPEILSTFLVPLFTVLITMPISFIVIGPIFSTATELLMNFFDVLIAFSPIVYGFILAFTWQALVVFGLHWAVVPMALAQFAENGWQNVLVPTAAVSFSAVAAIVALYFKIKDEKQKTLAIPAFVSGLVGITEPIIYGFTLPRKKVFVFTMIGGGISGAYVAATNVTAWNQGGLGIFQFPNFITMDGGVADLVNLLIAIAIGSTVSFLLTWFFHKEPVATEAVKSDETEGEKVFKSSKISSPIAGRVMPLSETTDKTFAQGLLGKGIVIKPSEGKVYAPADGVLKTLFSTNHAVGIVTDDGIEVLIHVGIDTVQLEGKHFTAKVQQGDRITKGQLLVEFDMEAIEAAGYSLETPVIITNAGDFTDVIETDEEVATTVDTLLSVVV